MVGLGYGLSVTSIQSIISDFAKKYASVGYSHKTKTLPRCVLANGNEGCILFKSENSGTTLFGLKICETSFLILDVFLSKIVSER